MAVYGTNPGPNFTVTDGNGNEIVLSTTVQGDGSNAFNVVSSGGGSGGGTSSAYGAAFPANGTAIGLTDGTAMRALAAINYSGGLYAAAVSIVQALPAGTNLIGKVGIDQTTPGTTNAVVVNTLATTPVAGTFSITTGGTAVNAFAANAVVSGGFIRNPYNATESLFVDIVNAAQNVQGGGTNGTSVELLAGDTFYVLPSTKAVSVNAATSGHVFVAVRY